MAEDDTVERLATCPGDPMLKADFHSVIFVARDRTSAEVSSSSPDSNDNVIKDGCYK